MMRVKLSDFEKSPATYGDNALQGPVIITQEGQDHLVLLAAAEYARLRRRDRRVGLAKEFPETDIFALENAEVPEEYNYLDALMDN